MVKVIIKLKGRKKEIIQNVRTVEDAKKTKRFVGKEGKVEIFSRGKRIGRKK